MQKDGMTLVNAVVGDDGRLLVTIEWPDGQTRILDRDEAVCLSLTLMNSASRLFPNAKEFGSMIDHAKAQVQPIHPTTRQ